MDSLDDPFAIMQRHERRESPHGSNTNSSRRAGQVTTVMHLSMSSENQEMVEETLLSLQYKDTDESLSNENKDYDDAEDQGFVTQDSQVSDISLTNPEGAAKAMCKESRFLRKFRRCGFRKEHCVRTLQLCSDDEEEAPEYLLNDTHNTSLSANEKETLQAGGTQIPQKILEERKNDKLACATSAKLDVGKRDRGKKKDYKDDKKKNIASSCPNSRKIDRQNRILQDEFRRKQGSEQYREMLSNRQRLPAWDMKETVTKIIAENQVVVISGMTGSGKTTQVPQFILDEALQQRDFKANIICTQPRRISAIAVAQRVADERVEKLGRSVGYQIRLECVKTYFTRLLYCTTGIVLRRLESDRNLEGVTHVIIDEVHERSEDSDLLLLILRDMLKKRPDLKVILMSATLNAELFSDYFEGCPVVEIPGQVFHVKQYFLEDVIEFSKYLLEEGSPYATTHKLTHARHDAEGPSDKETDMSLSPQQMKYRYPDYSSLTIKTLYEMDLEKINYDLIVQLLEWIVAGKHKFPKGGAILVFLPGYAEIQSLYDILLSTAEFGSKDKQRYMIIPLHSSLSAEDQNAVFQKPEKGVTKIVIATNIAETSITIDDIVYVVDAGRMKEKRYDQTKNMECLDTVWVSKANALQRKGRAGRVQEGVCFHLFTSHHFNFHLREQPTPEIQRIGLDRLVLKVKMLLTFAKQTLKTVMDKLIEPPSLEAIHGAVERLIFLGALDEFGERVTLLGYRVGSLPVDVRIGKLILYGAIFRCLDSALTIAAALSFKSPFFTPFDKRQEANEKRKEFAMGNSDYLTMLNAYKGWCGARKRGPHQAYLYCRENFLDNKCLQMIARQKQQYVELLSEAGFVSPGIRMRHIMMKAAKVGSDGVIEVTGSEANSNSDNWELITAILVAALYPNIARILSPNSACHAGKSDPLFKTETDDDMRIHPTSINFGVTCYPSPFLVYHKKVKTSQIYIRDCSMVSLYSLLLFAGGRISKPKARCRPRTHHENAVVLSLDRWINFSASPTVERLVRKLRFELDQLLSDSLLKPDQKLLTRPRGTKIISCVICLICNECVFQTSEVYSTTQFTSENY